jgi:hypothetical protein
MVAHQNFILAAESTGPEWWALVLKKLEPIFTRRIGVPRRLMSHDYGTNSVRETLLPEGLLNLQDVGSQEIVTIYAEDVSSGSMQLVVEGHFRTATISVLPKGDLREFLKQTWAACGEVVDAVLAGDELEVDEVSLDYVLRCGRIPDNLDLCQELIVRPRTSDSRSFTGSTVEHGGILVTER